MEGVEALKSDETISVSLAEKIETLIKSWLFMESLKIEYYEVREEKLPNLELTFDQMEEDLESVKVDLQTLLLNHVDISKNVSICDTALSNNDNSKSSFVKLPDLLWGFCLQWYVRGRVILDSASQSHFMTLQFASKIGLKKKKSKSRSQRIK
ncbi:uncharacterized protein TNCV_4772691 [Trichonephila clavipes]|nr:uncharacterized protein TNCV_4772691 [Trichonephila clavipes]